MMLPDLYLMRHGQTQWNAMGRLQGTLDSPLTPLGVEQAHRQATLLKGVGGICLSSPQGRAMQTAAIAFQGRDWSVEPRLSEIGIGIFSGGQVVDLRKRYPRIFTGDALDWYDHCPEGEGLDALRARCTKFLYGIDQATIIITHGVTLAMLLSVATGTKLANIGQNHMQQGCIYRLSSGTIDQLV